MENSQKRRNNQLCSSIVCVSCHTGRDPDDLQSLEAGCPLSCRCQKCQEQGYTRNLLVQNEESSFFGGPVMIRQPVSNHYNMLGYVSINYKQIYHHNLKNVIKIKATYLNAPTGLMRIIMTLKPKQSKYDLTVNSSDVHNWFVHGVRAKLYSSNRLGIPYSKFQGKITGDLCIKTFYGWKYKGAEITDRLRIQGQDQLRRMKEIWTRFELIDIEGLCLVIKYWNGLMKMEVGIPLRNLSEWLSAFLSLVKD